MTKPIRLVLILVVALITLFGAAIFVAWLLVGGDRLEQRLEAGLGDALDMEVQLGQPPEFGLLGGASVALAEVELRRDGEVVASVDSARVRLALFSLLAGQVRPLELHLERPRLSVEHFGSGEFNVYESSEAAEPFNSLSLKRLRVSDAQLNYLDQPSGTEWQFEGCNLNLSNIRHDGGGPAQVRATLAADGELTCQALSQGRLSVSDVSLTVEGENGVFDLTLENANAFEGLARGQLNVDLTTESPEFNLTSSLDQFEIQAFMAKLGSEQSTRGTLDFELVLSTQGSDWQGIRSGSEGTLSIKAGELVLDGFDLDEELEGYTDTQSFNLTDVGALFLAGPLGLVASRGYAFTGMLDGSGGSTQIDQLVSEWTIESGVAQAQDVAFRTPKNRLALAGGLDFVEYRFEQLQVAVVDRDGCAIVEQTVTGTFQEPEVKQPNFLVVAAGPLFDLVERGLEAVTDEDCEVFYDGSISHP